MNATNRVSIPTLPTNMVNIKMILLVAVNDEVIPNDSPQVVYADTDSNNRGIICWFGSEKFKRIKLNVMVRTDSKIMANALLTDSDAIFRLYISIDSLPLARATIFINAIAIVVTFTPPPVDPGETPIHIKVTNMIKVGILIKFRSTLLNPADRVELAMKIEVTHLPNEDLSAIRLLFCSRTKNDIVARMITVTLQTTINLELNEKTCGLYR